MPSPAERPRPWPARWPAELGRVLAVTPHPDDELFCAGLLASAAAAGAEVRLVCATRGERGWLNGRRAPAGETAAVRTPELGASCAALGIAAPRFLDLGDGAVARAPRRAIEEAVLAEAADLVLSYGPDGGYGHRDHVAVYRGVAAAVERQSPRPRWLQLAFPPGLFGGFAAEMKAKAPELLDPSVDLEALGAERGELDWIVEVAPVADAVRAAMRAHASQLRGEEFLSPAITRRLLEEEWYREPDA